MKSNLKSQPGYNLNLIHYLIFVSQTHDSERERERFTDYEDDNQWYILYSQKFHHKHRDCPPLICKQIVSEYNQIISLKIIEWNPIESISPSSSVAALLPPPISLHTETGVLILFPRLIIDVVSKKMTFRRKIVRSRLSNKEWTGENL